MVARINPGKNIRKVLHYNEDKVLQGKAEILHAHNFLMDAQDMDFDQKLRHFKKHMSLNEKAETNTMHVSLNFDPSEVLSNEKMITIAESYMRGIGFDDQPYLVYRHFDTGHPHIHLISTNIKADGSRISLHNLGRNESERTRKEIEEEFGLVRAESKNQADEFRVKPINATRINPGKRSTKAAISNVLHVVIGEYKYSSLEELNAVLKLYNVMADRCGKNSEALANKGLVFRVLNERGQYSGTPIKASLFHMKPTLTNLEKKFEANNPLKQPHSRRARIAIDYILATPGKVSLTDFIRSIEAQRISAVIHQNREGLIYGITYVDHQTKCVFNGSDLGKSYSAAAILSRCAVPTLPQGLYKAEKSGRRLNPEMTNTVPFNRNPDQLTIIPSQTYIPPAPLEYVPLEWKKRKKKSRKRRINK